jgi:hypothetical protein
MLALATHLRGSNCLVALALVTTLASGSVLLNCEPASALPAAAQASQATSVHPGGTEVTSSARSTSRLTVPVSANSHVRAARTR